MAGALLDASEGHCADPGCVIWFSNTLGETDRKGAAYCPRVRGNAPLGAPSGLKLEPRRRTLKRSTLQSRRNAVEVCLNFESAVMISFVTPSAKHFCWDRTRDKRESQRQ